MRYGPTHLHPERHAPVTTADFAPILLIGAVVVLVGVLAVRVASRVGLPSLLIYLGLGLFLGESGLGIDFENAELTQVLGLTALAIILAEGGLTTRWTSARPILAQGVVLSTVGVGVSVTITAGVAILVFGVDLPTALLFGAVVSSTDAAAVFASLRRLGLPARVTGTLELESGFNDAPAVILVVALSEALNTSGSPSILSLVGLISFELFAGAAIGILIGMAGAWLLRRSALPVSGLYPLATVALCLTGYATATVAHTSGFLAVYVCGLVLGNSALPHRSATLGFAEGLAWLAQIGLFVLLGLLASPDRLLGVLGPAILVGLALLLVARPVSVFLSVCWFKVPWREQAFLSWAGLRGAVPIVLATIPISLAVDGSERIFDAVFVLVVVFTVVQGTTLPTVARWLGLSTPLSEREVDVESSTLEELHAELLQLTVPPASRLHGVYVSELRLPPDAALTLLVRDGHSFVPEATTRLVRGDQLLVVTTIGSRETTMRRLRAVSRAGRLARWHGEVGSRLAD
ncbi:MAG: potassium/proton antiporter [Geodermatophilaceae bacterium]|nr:potassium/proton antiporter [Geodermatophilaceae bacterium]